MGFHRARGIRGFIIWIELVIGDAALRVFVLRPSGGMLIRLGRCPPRAARSWVIGAQKRALALGSRPQRLQNWHSSPMAVSQNSTNAELPPEVSPMRNTGNRNVDLIVGLAAEVFNDKKWTPSSRDGPQHPSRDSIYCAARFSFMCTANHKTASRCRTMGFPC